MSDCTSNEIIIIIIHAFVVPLEALLSVLMVFSAICRTMFPKGVPDEFSFVATLRLRGPSTVDEWDLIRIDDSVGTGQFGISLDGLNKEMEVYMPSVGGEIQSITFSDSPPITEVSQPR